MDLNAAVVVNKAQFPEFVHEEAHARPCRSDHFRQRLLTDLRNDRLRLAFLAEIRQQQEKPGKTFLARIEQLVDEVRFDADGSPQQMGNEHLRERGLLMDHADDRGLLQTHDDGVRHGRNRRDALQLPGKATFPEEIVRPENCDDSFLALLGNDGDLRLAFLNEEDRVRTISLREDDLALPICTNASALADLGEESFRIERRSTFARHDRTFLPLFWRNFAPS